MASAPVLPEQPPESPEARAAERRRRVETAYLAGCENAKKNVSRKKAILAAVKRRGGCR